MVVSPAWDESTPRYTPAPGSIGSTGTRGPTRLYISRESCERVLMLGTGVGGVSVELARTGSGFYTATLVEPGPSPFEPGVVLFSASLDFMIASTPEPQTVRILDLPLGDQGPCPSNP
jgi:hypothetical protein